MAQPRKLKKSESLEIRIPHPTKEAFMARCRDEGRSASEALRAFIEAHLDEPRPRPVAGMSPKTWRLIAGTAIAAAVGAAAVPSLARVVQAPAHMRGEFVRMDANGDGVVDFGEYRRHRSAPAR